MKAEDGFRPDFARLRAVRRAKRATIAELAAVAGLDPQLHFRFSDLHGVDWRGTDHTCFDLTGAIVEFSSMAPEAELVPKIVIIGIGRSGCNSVNHMIDRKLQGVRLAAADTSAETLSAARAHYKLQLGASLVGGSSTGGKPQIGAQAAEESLEELVDVLAGSHMCFIIAGMGGGTGTGTAPVIARIAREMGILTVGVVTKPFKFEGAKRTRLAESGIDQLQAVVDTLIIISNENLYRLADDRTTLADAFMLADDMLYRVVMGVTDLLVRPGLIKLGFADVRAVIDEMGKAMMGTGEAEGETRAIDAAEKAIANPLMDEVCLEDAKGVLINITGGYDLTLFELDEAANRIRSEVGPNAAIIVGSSLDPELSSIMRVSVIVTGLKDLEREERQAAQTEGKT